MCVHKERRKERGIWHQCVWAMGEHMRQAQGTEDVCKPISKQMGPVVAWTRRGLLALKEVTCAWIKASQPPSMVTHTRAWGRYPHTDTLSTLNDSQRTYFPVLLFFLFFFMSHQATLCQTKQSTKKNPAIFPFSEKTHKSHDAFHFICRLWWTITSYQHAAPSKRLARQCSCQQRGSSSVSTQWM